MASGCHVALSEALIEDDIDERVVARFTTIVGSLEIPHVGDRLAPEHRVVNQFPRDCVGRIERRIVGNQARIEALGQKA
ncbi:hypothetical protein D3C72_2205230 [compost metagenome]